MGVRSADRVGTRSVCCGVVREHLPTYRAWSQHQHAERSGAAPEHRELSEYLNVPIRTLYDWRLAGKGPCAVHVGRQLRYFVSDVHDWLRNQRELEPGRSPDGR